MKSKSENIVQKPEFAVVAKDLSRNFGKFIAVDQVNFKVEYGEVFGFLGANGAGKTTVIRMLCGLLAPSSGEGWVNGYSTDSEPEKIKKQIGYMSQKFSLYDDLTVRENLNFYGGIYGMPGETIEIQIESILKRLKMGSFKDRMTSSIPLGWKQKLALGCSVIHSPRVLFLDEPTGGVDPVARREFWDLIYEISAKGTTVFVTTHYMDEAEYCNRVSIMVEGKIVVIDSPIELKNQTHKKSMQEVFLHLVKS